MMPLKHGHAKNGSTPNSRTYQIWSDMKRRCRDPKRRAYKRYGGRGITYCPEWEDFTVFLADMGEAPEGLTLDRKDNDGGYSKNNCRWATAKEQGENTSTAMRITFNGETHCVAEWERIFGVGRGLFCGRLRRGWTPEQAFTTPIETKHHRKPRTIQ